MEENQKIIEKISREVQKDGESSIEDFNEDMLQFSKMDVLDYVKNALEEKNKR